MHGITRGNYGERGSTLTDPATKGSAYVRKTTPGLVPELKCGQESAFMISPMVDEEEEPDAAVLVTCKQGSGVLAVSVQATSIKEGGVLKIEKGDLFRLITGNEKEGPEAWVAPRLKVRAAGESGTEKFAVSVQKGTDEKPVICWLGLEKVAEQLKDKIEALREKLSQSKEKQVKTAPPA